MNDAPSFDAMLKAFIEQIAYGAARRAVEEHRREIDDLIRAVAAQRNDIIAIVTAVQESGTFEQAVYDACNALFESDEALSDSLDARIERVTAATMTAVVMNEDDVREIVHAVIRNDLTVSVDIE